jgi:hypothetical protein
MKLSKDTLTVLKNFASINDGIMFRKGSVLRTCDASKQVLAETTIPEAINEDFGIYDLNQFLSVHSLGKDTELDFDSNNVVFKSGRSKTKYRMTAKTMIVSAPEKELTLPSVDGSFKLKDEDLAQALKNAAVLGSPNIAFESDGSKISVTCFNAKDDSAHTNTIEIGTTDNDKVYKAVFLVENFKMIPGTYDVQVSSKGLASFVNEKGDLQYWIAIEAKESKFGE